MHKDDPLSNLPSVENTDSSAVPSNSTTGDSTADADQQGIFSSSDTRVETENLPEIPEVVQQAPMSSITPALRTTSTVTGDLKLGNAPKKRKWPWVLLGAVVLAVIGVAVWLAVENTEPSMHGEAPQYNITEESRQLFNRYTNFLLNDDDSTNKPDLISFLGDEYTLLSPGAMFTEKVKSDDDIDFARSYLNDLNAMYNEFSQAFFSSSDNTEDVTEEYSRSAIPDYFYEAAKGSYLNLNQIVNLYLRDGEEPVRDLLENTFKSASENETVQSILAARKQLLELYLQVMIQANQDGCIVNGSLNTNCARPRLAAIDGENLRLTVLINDLETELRQAAIANLENIYYAFYPDEVIVEGSTS